MAEELLESLVSEDFQEEEGEEVTTHSPPPGMGHLVQ
jgi:hypothetical protein